MCDTFLSQKKRPAVLECLQEIGIWRDEVGRCDQLTDIEVENFRYGYQDTKLTLKTFSFFRRLIEGLSVIGRVTACSQKVKVLELRKFCQNYHMFIMSTWPLIFFSESAHRLPNF